MCAPETAMQWIAVSYLLALPVAMMVGVGLGLWERR